jgi:hypothetical protein
MGVQLSATITCDVCNVKTNVSLELTKLVPSVAMHILLPDGWSARTKQFSGELYVHCKGCAKKKIALPTPVILSAEELEEVRAKLKTRSYPPKKK